MLAQIAIFFMQIVIFSFFIDLLILTLPFFQIPNMGVEVTLKMEVG